mmetsp:Transcript_60428/g.156945  ORF Transcript_60428/g.156945 Transcript_60428/m.156945 type:complete len:211 (-) Transcript_60428:812-1444(-)
MLSRSGNILLCSLCDPHPLANAAQRTLHGLSPRRGSCRDVPKRDHSRLRNQGIAARADGFNQHGNGIIRHLPGARRDARGELLKDATETLQSLLGYVPARLHSACKIQQLLRGLWELLLQTLLQRHPRELCHGGEATAHSIRFSRSLGHHLQDSHDAPHLSESPHGLIGHLPRQPQAARNEDIQCAQSTQFVRDCSVAIDQRRDELHTSY